MIAGQKLAQAIKGYIKAYDKGEIPKGKMVQLGTGNVDTYTNSGILTIRFDIVDPPTDPFQHDDEDELE